MSRYLAIDYGLARIGFAISDEKKILATPYGFSFNHKNKEKLYNKILTIIKEQKIALILLGLPLLENGNETRMSGEVRNFKQTFSEFLLEQKISIDIIYVSEICTSKEAESRLRSLNASHKDIKDKIDSFAASIMMQEYLNNEENNDGENRKI